MPKYLNFLISEDEVKKDITIGKLKEKDVDMIWSNLGLNDDISLEGKEKVINLAMTMVKENIGDSGMAAETSIPVSSIGSMIPDDLKGMLNHDIFNPDIDVKMEALQSLRNDCSKGKMSSEEICNALTLTNYDNLMQELPELNAQSGQDIPEPILNSIDNFNTIDKVREFIKEKSGFWVKFLILTILMYGLAVLCYYLHFFLFNRKFDWIDIPYYISKINLLNLIPAIIVLGATYYLFTNESTSQYFQFGQSAAEMEAVNIDITSLPIFEVLYDITIDFIMLNVYFVVFSVVLFVGLFCYRKWGLKSKITDKEKEKAEQS